MRRVLLVLLACGGSARADVRAGARRAADVAAAVNVSNLLQVFREPATFLARRLALTNWTLDTAGPLEHDVGVREMRVTAQGPSNVRDASVRSHVTNALADTQLELGHVKLFGDHDASLSITGSGVGISFLM